MKRIIYLSFVVGLITLFGCTSEINSRFFITGIINDSSIRTVYIAEAHAWDIFLDSVMVSDGKFNISLKKKDYNQLLYSIAFVDSSNKIRKLFFNNYVLSPDSVKYLIDAFIFSTDTIIISPNKTEASYNDIAAGSENEAFFNTQMINFGYFSGSIEKRTEQLSNYMSIIKKYPDSQYLLSCITESKSTGRHAELRALLNSFSEECQQTKLAVELFQYLSGKKDNIVLEDFVLQKSDSGHSNIFGNPAKINMLLIWASWCGPCRREIPEIKKLHDRFSSKGLTIVSISIDDSEEAWKKAVLEEQMEWRQLRVPQQLKNEFERKYEISSIPCAIFTDSRGRVITRQVGYDDNAIAEYEALISERVK